MSDVGDLYFDPYDVAIHADPYPTFKRLRDEAPLYYNERYDFYALSRFADVQAGFRDHVTYSSARGTILEAIKAGITIPKGVFIMEDPPIHTAHRGVLSRVFTPRNVSAVEPEIRRYCAEVLDPLAGAGGFDFVADVGAKVPMRVIGMLRRIPEAAQEAIERAGEYGLRREPGKPSQRAGRSLTVPTFFGDYLDWRSRHPADDLMTDLLAVEFEDEAGEVRRRTRDEI